MHDNRKKKAGIIVITISIITCLLAIISAPNAAFATQVDNSSSLTVEDSHGEAIKPYIGEDGATYLFLPNDVDFHNVVITSSKKITSSSLDLVSNNGYNITADMGESYSVSGSISYADGNSATVSLMRSNLPSVSISLNGTTLADIQSNKDEKHPGNSVYIDNSVNSKENLVKEDSVEIKGRGNSSWNNYDKKGYQIKFDKKQSVLGMKKAKKWTLIADSSDPTLLRNDVAYHIADQMDFEYSPSMRKADLWIDGEYLGTYSIIEKVEINDNRLALSDNGILAELDDAFYQTETYFTDDVFGYHMCLKDPDIEDVKSNSWSRFGESWNTAMRALDENDWDTVKEQIDVDSFAKYYIIEEYLKNDESCTTSRFYYQDGGKIYAGPVWDFDTSMDAYESLADYYWGSYDKIYSRLLKYEAFNDLVIKYYNEYKSAFEEAGDYLESEASSIEESANMNYARWNVLGTVDAKSNKFLGTYNDNVNRTYNWLANRYATFTVPVQVPGVGSIPTESDDPSRIKMFRLYNPYSGEHFYTSSASEANSIIVAGWRYEGVGWIAPNDGDPVYRLYNPYAGEHHYTLNIAERDSLIEAGWNDEGIGWYSDANKTVPVYREYNPNAYSCNHNYTENIEEHKSLIEAGWNDEGIGWYALRN